MKAVHVMADNERTLNAREATLAIMAGRDPGRVLFQPRLEPWFDDRRRRGLLPKEAAGDDLFSFYQRYGFSMRYMSYFTGLPDPIERTYLPCCRHRIIDSHNARIEVVDTPYGEMTWEHRLDVDGGFRTVAFPVRDPEDFPKLEWLIEQIDYTFHPERFEAGDRAMGDLGYPQFWVPKSPWQAMAHDWMRFEDFVFAVQDDEPGMMRLLERIDRSYDSLYRQIVEYGRTKIVTFGENIHGGLISPKRFEHHVLPFYEKRVAQLREADIMTHVHIDGNVKSLLPLLSRLPMDGIEALTPVPQGDVTIPEIRDHLGDKVLLDGIPAILFLGTYTRETLQKCVEELVSQFHPRLILGISDEFPLAAGPEGFERLKWVAEYCRDV